MSSIFLKNRHVFNSILCLAAWETSRFICILNAFHVTPMSIRILNTKTFQKCHFTLSVHIVMFFRSNKLVQYQRNHKLCYLVLKSQIDLKHISGFHICGITDTSMKFAKNLNTISDHLQKFVKILQFSFSGLPKLIKWFCKRITFTSCKINFCFLILQEIKIKFG